MSVSERDTIYARATAPGRAGVAVVRVSGPDAFFAVEHLTGRCVSGRGMRYGELRSADGKMIDRALILSFQAPKSFTGENIVEFQVHGSIAVIDMLLSELSTLTNFRHAEAGEFTRRALENGRLTLSEVEGLGDLIDAQTSAQQQQAIKLFSGDLGARADQWRDWLLNAIALVVVSIDFADEDVPQDISPEVLVSIQNIRQAIDREIAGSTYAERLREGFEVVIAGRPNVGKSTLLNCIARRVVAITSDIPGTTRDALEVQMDLDGLPVTLVDTAGVRKTRDEVEELGVRLAHQRVENADLVLLLTDGLDGEAFEVPQAVPVLKVRTKVDLSVGVEGVSGLTGDGVPELLKEIFDILSEKNSESLANRERHRNALQRASLALDRAQQLIGSDGAEAEILVMELEAAESALQELIGRIGVEDVLGAVFSSFCIGK